MIWELRHFQTAGKAVTVRQAATARQIESAPPENRSDESAVAGRFGRDGFVDGWPVGPAKRISIVNYYGGYDVGR